MEKQDKPKTKKGVRKERFTEKTEDIAAMYKPVGNTPKQQIDWDNLEEVEE